ncbi:MAG: hypothetical protein BWY53_00818 [Parcubacteria group bacterium ADurb.Bin326]|nr:MAG: hypothetical protein BWY53_00818 [Parcubacteria group bacterium ADurb.Bin326]
MKNLKNAVVISVLLVVVALLQGCPTPMEQVVVDATQAEQSPPTQTTPVVPVDSETDSTVVTGDLKVKGSFRTAKKAYSDAAVANFISEMARRCDQIGYKIGDHRGEATPDVNGNFVFSVDGLTIGKYQMRVTASCKATSRQFFVWEGTVTINGGNQQLNLMLEPVASFETTIVVDNIPSTCSTGRVENGRCYLIDSNGDAYEATTPEGSGCNIYRQADGRLTLCAMAEFPLSAEIVSVIVTDDYNTPFQTSYKFNCLDWMDGSVGWATFPDEVSLDVTVGLNTQDPPTVYIITAGDGNDYAWLDCGNFVFSAGWEMTDGPGFINSGCHIFLGDQEITTPPDAAIQLSQTSFYITWSCGGSPYEGFIEDYSVRVIRNEVVISPEEDEEGNLFYGW